MEECIQRECQFFLDTVLLDDLRDWLQESETRMVEFEKWQSARRAVRFAHVEEPHVGL